MRVITLNCNGIRSAARKGMFDWLARQKADYVCLQETRAQPADLEDECEVFFPKGWHAHLNSAAKKGYAGVALYTRARPDQVLSSLGAAEFDGEGRYLEVRHGNLSVVSLYAPSGSAGPERQASKDHFLNFFLPHERAWMDRVLGDTGWVDAYRQLHPDAEGTSYTWWSNRGQAWARNVGWRIDYQVVSPALRARLKRAAIYKNNRFSDHAPLTLDYDL